MEPTFKAAEPGDTDVLLEMRREFCRHQELPFDDRLDRAVLERLLADPSLGGAWLIELGGEAAGYVVLTLGFSLEFHGRDAFVDELYIREPHRRRGLAGRALAFVEDVCRALGVSALHLEVGRANTRAQAVYQKAGFEDRSNFLLTKWIAPRPPCDGHPGPAPS